MTKCVWSLRKFMLVLGYALCWLVIDIKRNGSFAVNTCLGLFGTVKIFKHIYCVCVCVCVCGGGGGGGGGGGVWFNPCPYLFIIVWLDMHKSVYNDMWRVLWIISTIPNDLSDTYVYIMAREINCTEKRLPSTCIANGSIYWSISIKLSTALLIATKFVH